jgi:hypothetical protein
VCTIFSKILLPPQIGANQMKIVVTVPKNAFFISMKIGHFFKIGDHGADSPRIDKNNGDPPPKKKNHYCVIMTDVTELNHAFMENYVHQLYKIPNPQGFSTGLTSNGQYTKQTLIEDSYCFIFQKGSFFAPLFSCTKYPIFRVSQQGWPLMVSTLVVQNTLSLRFLNRGDLLWPGHQLYKIPDPRVFQQG